MKGWAIIAVGVAVLAFVARPLPAFFMPAMLADWWLRLVVGDPSGGMATAYAMRWMFIEVPIFTPIGIGLIACGVKEVRK